MDKEHTENTEISDSASTQLASLGQSPSEFMVIVILFGIASLIAVTLFAENIYIEMEKSSEFGATSAVFEQK